MNSQSKLVGSASKYILVPYEFIVDKTIDSQRGLRGLVYAYLYVKTGIDNTLVFNTENFKEYAGKTTGVDYQLDTYASKILYILDCMNGNWFLSYNDAMRAKRNKEVYFDKDNIWDYCSEHQFAVIYLDELNTILSYKSHNIHDNRFDNAMILLVFMYLRANIPIRHNKHCNNAEAYNAYYKTIGNDMGLSERIVSKAISVLVDLGLIYVKERSPIKYYDKKSKDYKFRTPTNIFCNTYKRIKKGVDIYLEESGSRYYLSETERKVQYLDAHNII